MALPTGPRPGPTSNPVGQAFDGTLRAVLDLGKTTAGLTAQFDNLTASVKGATSGGVGSRGPSALPVISPLARPPLPVIRPRPVGVPIPDRVPVGNVIYPVRLVRFESQAMGQLASLLTRAASAGANRGLANRGGAGVPGLPNVFRPITVAAAGATASILGLARAGLSGTIEGNKLSNEFLMLSRNVAAIFLPVVELLTAKMQKLNFTLMRLDGNGQDKLMRGGLAVAGVGAIGGGLTAIVPALSPILGLFTGMIPPLVSLAAAGGPVTLALGVVAAAVGVAVVAVGGGLAYLLVVSKPVRDAVWQVVGALEKVWAATQPVRAALFDLISSAAVAFFQQVAAVLADIANDPAFVVMMNEVGGAIKRTAAVIPELIKNVVALAEAANFAILALGPFFGLMNGFGQLQVPRPPEQPKVPKEPDLDKLMEGFKIVGEDFAKQWERKQGRTMTPFQPGRSDAVGYINSITDNFLKIGNDPAKQAVAELIAIKLGQQGLVMGIQELGRLLGFNMRPDPNGRPGVR